MYFWSLGISLYLELFCFLSFITIVLRNLCSGTHRRNRNFPTWFGTPGKDISLKNAVALFCYAKDNCFCDTERTNIFIYVNLFDFFENQPNEICIHLSKRRHSNKGKGKQKRKSEEKERRRREKNNGCTLSFYNSYQKSG